MTLIFHSATIYWDLPCSRPCSNRAVSTKIPALVKEGGDMTGLPFSKDPCDCFLQNRQHNKSMEAGRWVGIK